MNPAPPHLSIIIPAFNEEIRLPKTIEDIGEYLASKSMPSEMIVVDDGSTDSTAAIVERYRVRYPQLRLVSNGQNRGKGFSVRHGMLEALGEIALFTDADLSAPIAEADKLIEPIEAMEYDATIGSRAMERSRIEIHQAAIRETAGFMFNRLARLIVGVKFSDTQCGFKAFRRERSIAVFEQQRVERFGFDPEILFLAKRHGLQVAEIPVRWSHDPRTKVHVLSDGLKMVWDLMMIRWNAFVGRYPLRGKT